MSKKRIIVAGFSAFFYEYRRLTRCLGLLCVPVGLQTTCRYTGGLSLPDGPVLHVGTYANHSLCNRRPGSAGSGATDLYLVLRDGYYELSHETKFI